jgi:lipopolysaccharide/colanic/teichoic acid biosynthesis glycosyltransferase
MLKSYNKDIPDYFKRVSAEKHNSDPAKELFIKRSFDIVVSLGGLIVSFPIWIIVVVAILIEDGRPIFFRQKRLGKLGRVFYVYKFRSMINNAENVTGPVWANKDDHRITRVGRFIRRTALDELPQLYNILVGDMSFVGPRAERPELALEFKKTIPNFDYRLLVKPGLTGLAQVYGNYNTTPKNKLRYDMLYILNRSFWLDLKLMVASFWITFTFSWESKERAIDKLIGEIILESGMIDADQLDDALDYQRAWGGKIGEILIKKGYLAQEKLGHYLNVQITMNTLSNVNNGNRDYLIGEVMLASGVITGNELSQALEYQKKKGGKMGVILRNMGYVSEAKLKYCLARQIELRNEGDKEVT